LLAFRSSLPLLLCRCSFTGYSFYHKTENRGWDGIVATYNRWCRPLNGARAGGKQKRKKKNSSRAFSVPRQGSLGSSIANGKKASVQKLYNIILLKGVWPMVTCILFYPVVHYVLGKKNKFEQIYRERK